MNQALTLAICASLSLLAACGGGNYSAPDAPAVTAEVPQSASQSSAGMVDYLGRLALANADALEPLDVSKFAPPQPDDNEPSVLN